MSQNAYNSVFGSGSSYTASQPLSNGYFGNTNSSGCDNGNRYDTSYTFISERGSSSSYKSNNINAIDVNNFFWSTKSPNA